MTRFVHKTIPFIITVVANFDLKKQSFLVLCFHLPLQDPLRATLVNYGRSFLARGVFNSKLIITKNMCFSEFFAWFVVKDLKRVIRIFKKLLRIKIQLLPNP
ncbi:MAG: hypothetical protein CVU43_19585 [Chloroflexi bacterium HGW-Chloroflexi-5]|nr:MAG: hypothetical protein CVU43_19585 [Chloroflexi bacterium HGW-Chloroflexi-5]